MVFLSLISHSFAFKYRSQNPDQSQFYSIYLFFPSSFFFSRDIGRGEREYKREGGRERGREKFGIYGRGYSQKDTKANIHLLLHPSIHAKGGCKPEQMGRPVLKLCSYLVRVVVRSTLSVVLHLTEPPVWLYTTGHVCHECHRKMPTSKTKNGDRFAS